MIRAIDTIMAGLNRLTAALAATLLGLATTAVLTQIFVRFVLPRLGLFVSAPWTEESARFLMAWSVFLGVAVLCRRGGLIAITTLPSALPPHISRLVVLASTVCAAVFFAVLLVVGWQWSIAAMRETSTVLRLPMGTIYAAMPIGAALSLANLTLYARDLFRVPDAVVMSSLAPSSAD